LRLVVSITLLAVLIGGLDLRQSLEFLRLARLDLLLLAVLAVGLDRLFAAYRWYVLLPREHPNISFGQIVRFIFVSGFLGFIVPGGIGAEAVRIYSLSRATADLALSFSSVLVERFFAVLALVFLTLFGLILSPRGLPPEFSLMAYFCLAVVVAAVAILMIPALRAATIALLQGRYLAPVRERLVKLYARLDDYKDQPMLMMMALLLAFLFQLQRIARVIIVAWALGIDIEEIYFLIFMPIIILATLLPISIAGFGVREAGFVYLFGLIGVAPEAAFTLGIVSFLVTLSAVPVGAWFYLRERSR
jgi:uncharacterized protein (TIRG00374 family)